MPVSHEVANRLADFTVNTRIGDVAPGAITFVKQLALKTVAGMLAGSAMHAGRQISEFVKANPDGAETGVVGHDFRASLWKAVFANAFFAHQSELEDDRLTSGTSWDITTFPMLFPLAEQRGLRGVEMVEASVIGLEVMARTCQFYPQGHMGLSIVPPSIGPSALAARVMKLDAERTASAFGLCMSGIPIAYANFGTDAHFFESTMQTVHGLMAAQCASLGLTSNPDIVRFLAGLLGKERVDESMIVGKLGEEWQFQEIWLKKYPCCLYIHRYIDGLLEIVSAEELTHERIDSITVHVAAGAMEVCNRPDPRTMGDLQFSFQHVLASASLERDVNYRHIAIERVADPVFIAARSKVKVVVPPEWKARLPVETPARLEIRTVDGKEFASTRQYPTGSIHEPLSTDYVKGLFVKFVGDVLPDADKRYAADAIASLEELDRKDVANLIAVLTKAKGRARAGATASASAASAD
jgi:2-methylcitrate dehydratase PrpD